MSFFQRNNSNTFTGGSTGPSNFFGSNNQRTDFFGGQSGGQNQANPGSFFNRGNSGVSQGVVNNGHQNNSGTQNSFFNRGVQNPSQSNQNSFQGVRSRDYFGTFTLKYAEPTSQHRECAGNKVACLIAMPEYEAQKLSTFRKRCEDYMCLKSGNVPNDNYILGLLKNSVMQGHLNPSVVDPKLVDALKNSTFQPQASGRESFQSASQFFGTRGGTGQGQTNSSFFGSNNSNANGGNQNGFLKNNGGNNGLGVNNNSSNGSFFGNQGAQSNTTPSFFQNSGSGGNQGNSGTGNNSGVFFQNRGGSGGSNPGSFFNNTSNNNTSNQQQGNSGGFFNRGTSGNSVVQSGGQQQQSGQGRFFQPQGTGQSNTSGNSGGFFNNSANNNSGNANSFLTGNQNRSGGPTNQNSSNFFQSGQNSGNFFQNSRQGQNSVLTSNNSANGNNNLHNFFKNNNDNGSGNNSYFQNANNQMNQNGDPGFFGMPKPGFMGEGMYPMYPGYGQYPGIYLPYMAPYPPNMFIPVPLSVAQEGIDRANTKRNTLSSFSNLPPLSLDQYELEKKLEKATAEELKKQINEMERQSYIVDRYLSTLKNDEDDFFSESSTRITKPPVIIKKANESRSLANQSLKSKASLSLKTLTEGGSFLTSRSPIGPEKDRVNFGASEGFDKQVKSQFNKLVSLKVVAAFEDYPTFLDDLKVNKYKTIRELKAYLANKLPKFSHSVEDIVFHSEIYIDDLLCEDSTQLRDFPNIDGQELFMKISLKTNVGGLNDRFSKSLKKSPFTMKAPLDKIEEHEQDLDSPKLSPSKPQSLCAFKSLPILTKQGYVLSPSILQLSRLTEEELKQVENVTLSNEFGEIRWLGKTDVTGVNFDLWVIIKKDSVDVYPDDLFDERTKPARGSKLNRPAEITLRNIFPRNDRAKENFKERLEEMCAKQGAKLLSYDDETGEWKFKAYHFTIYSFLDLEEEEDSGAKEDHNVIREEKSTRPGRRSFELVDAHVGKPGARLAAEERIDSSAYFRDDNIGNFPEGGPKKPKMHSSFNDSKQLAKPVKETSERPNPRFRNKKMNMSDSFKFVLRDQSRTENVILENSEEDELIQPLKRQGSKGALSSLQEENFHNFVRESIHKRIKEFNSGFDEFKKTSLQLSKQAKGRIDYSTNTELLNQVTLLNKFYGEDFIWPENSQQGSVQFCNDFAFGVGWRNESSAFAIDGRVNYFDLGSSLHSHFKLDSRLLSVFQQALVNRHKILTAEGQSYNETWVSYGLLISFYEELQNNKLILTPAVWRPANFIIRLALELFLLIDLKPEEAMKENNFAAMVRAQRERRYHLLTTENALFNQINRRKLFLWIQDYLLDNGTKNDSRGGTFNRISQQGKNNPSILLGQYQVAKFDNISLQMQREQQEATNEKGLILEFYQFMEKTEHEAKSLEELIQAFPRPKTESISNETDGLFINLLKNYAEISASLKHGKTRPSLIDLTTGMSRKSNLAALLNLVLVVALQRDFDFANFAEVFPCSYTRAEEVLIQNHNYMSAYGLLTLCGPFLSNFEERQAILLRQYYLHQSSDIRPNEEQKEFFSHLRKSNELASRLKVFEHIVNGNSTKIIKSADEFGMNNQVLDLVLTQISVSTLRKCFVDPMETEAFLLLLNLAEEKVPIDRSPLIRAVKACLQFFNLYHSQALSELLVRSIFAEMFDCIKTVKYNEPTETQVEVLETICEGVLTVLTTKRFEFTDYVQREFVPFVLSGEFELVLNSTSRSALLSTWIARLN